MDSPPCFDVLIHNFGEFGSWLLIAVHKLSTVVGYFFAGGEEAQNEPRLVGGRIPMVTGRRLAPLCEQSGG
jgi:hypothetical protein